MRKWAGEVATKGRFAAALPPDQAAGNPGGLPVPCLVVSNKADQRGALLQPTEMHGCRHFRTMQQPWQHAWGSWNGDKHQRRPCVQAGGLSA